MCAGTGCLYTKWDGGCGCKERPRYCEEKEREEYEAYLAEKADMEYDRLQEEPFTFQK